MSIRCALGIHHWIYKDPSTFVRNCNKVEIKLFSTRFCSRCRLVQYSINGKMPFKGEITQEWKTVGWKKTKKEIN